MNSANKQNSTPPAPPYSPAWSAPSIDTAPLRLAGRWELLTRFASQNIKEAKLLLYPFPTFHQMKTCNLFKVPYNPNPMFSSQVFRLKQKQWKQKTCWTINCEQRETCKGIISSHLHCHNFISNKRSWKPSEEIFQDLWDHECLGWANLEGLDESQTTWDC